MTVQDFYDRVEAARGSLSFRKYFLTLEGATPGMASGYHTCRRAGRLPVVDCILVFAHLFTFEELFDLLVMRYTMPGIIEREEEKALEYLNKHYKAELSRRKRLTNEAWRLHSYNVLGG